MSTKDPQHGSLSTSFPSGDSQDYHSNAVNDDGNPLAILIYAAAALIILPILYKLGAGATVLVLVLAVALNAIPEVRQIIDSFLGKSPSGRHRLPIQVASGSRSPNNEINEKPSIYDERPTSEELQYVGLDVGDVLQIPLTRLVALIQRDFISFWYNTSVCLSPSTPFPMHTQSLLNVTTNNLVSRMRRQEPKEVSIYLFHSASTAIISQIRQAKSPSSKPQDALKEKNELLRKVRRTSEELLLTLAPRSATASPIVLSLLSEVLSLQIWSTIQSVGNADFINTSIVSHFGKAVKVVKKVQADAAEANGHQQQEDTAGDGLDEAVKLAEEQIEAAEDKPLIPPALPPRVDKGKGRQVEQAREPEDAPRETTFAASNFPGLLNVFPGQVAQEAINKSNKSVSPSNASSAPTSAPLASASALNGPPPEEAGPSNSHHQRKLSLASTPISPSPSTSGISQHSAVRSPPASTPSSPRVSKTAKLPETERHERNLTDRTLDEAIDAGVVKLRSFGTRFLTGATKLLDAALPPDEPAKTPTTPAPKAPSLKGKERERDPADSPRGSIESVRPASPRPASIASRISMATSSIGLSSAISSEYGQSATGPSNSKPSSRRSSVVLSALSSPATSVSALAPGQAPSQAAAPMSPSVRCQIILDTFLTSNSETREKQAKALERSLFSKDPSLLFPEPQDPQLKAVLAHHITSADTSDSELVNLSDNFHTFLEDGEHEDGEALLRLWTQLDHFGYMVSMTKATEQQMQEDAIGVLKKTVAQTVDLREMQSADKETVDGFWTAVETVLLRLAQNPTKDLFEPLQDWYMKMVQSRYWEQFLQQNPNDMAMSQSLDLIRSPTQSTFSSLNDNFPEQSTSTSMSRSASTKMARSISSSSNKPPSPSVSKRTLDWSNAALQKDDSLDLGESMSMHDEPEPTPSFNQSRPSSVHLGQSSKVETDDLPDETADVSTPGLEESNVLPKLTSESTATLTSIGSTDELSAPPAFSVTLTDLSPPSAYANNHVKNRKELEFLVAVEVEGSPGYILARKYVEFEKMDTGIKKALPQSGTKSFPRAPLPSTNFQTSENLCNSLSHYLEALLRDDRYAASDPVATFFAKERTDSKGNAQPLAFLGRGVNNIGKGVTGVTRGIGKSGEMAIGGIATGFGQFGKAVTTIPGLRKSPSGPVETLKGQEDAKGTAAEIETKSPAPSESGLQLDTQPEELKPEMTLIDALPLSDAPVTETDGKGASTAKQPPPLPPRADILPPRSSSPEGYEVSSPPTVQEERPEAPPGFSYTPRKKQTGPPNTSLLSGPTSPTHQQSILLPQIHIPTSPTLRGRMSFDELVKKDEEAQKVQRASLEESQPSLLKAAPTSKSTSEPGIEGSRAASPSPDLSLTPVEFNNVLSFAMAILEEAYDLVDSTWNLKRGILKMLETILRTRYANVIKAGMTKLVTMASQEQFYAQGIDNLRESFWPPPDDVWWSSVPDYKPVTERTAEEKEATRKEARHLVIMQAPEGLKVSLGAAATAEAFGRLHDSLQGPGGERLVAGLMLDYLRLLLL